MHWLLLLTCVGLAAGVAGFAGRWPEYRHVARTISELGEVGAPDQRAVALGLFLPFGLAAMTVAALSWPDAGAGAVMIGAMGFAYAASAVFPCDAGAPVIGTLANTLHAVAGAIGYGVAAGTLRELADQRTELLFDAAFWLVAGFILVYLTGWPRQYLGLIQRLAEASIMAAGFLILRGGR